MNDPERRRWSDGFDDDAIFADIVAHLDDNGPEEQPAAESADQDAPTDDESTASPAAAAGESPDVTRHGPTDLASGKTPAARPGHWSVNPPPWPPAHDDPATSAPTDLPADPPADARPVPAAQAWRAHEVEEDEDHFQPPPVRPLPAGDLQFWAIIVGMCGGPLLLLYLVLFNRDASSYWILVAIAMSVGGFALLVTRMPGRHGDDDDGARL